MSCIYATIVSGRIIVCFPQMNHFSDYKQSATLDRMDRLRTLGIPLIILLEIGNVFPCYKFASQFSLATGEKRAYLRHGWAHTDPSNSDNLDGDGGGRAGVCVCVRVPVRARVCVYDKSLFQTKVRIQWSPSYKATSSAGHMLVL